MAKEKQVDLKPKAEKISKEHLDQLQKVVNTINRIQLNIGKLESTKHGLLHDLAITQNEITKMQDVLQKEYGSFDVNVNDGTINWKTNEE